MSLLLQKMLTPIRRQMHIIYPSSESLRQSAERARLCKARLSFSTVVILSLESEVQLQFPGFQTAPATLHQHSNGAASSQILKFGFSIPFVFDSSGPKVLLPLHLSLAAVLTAFASFPGM